MKRKLSMLLMTVLTGTLLFGCGKTEENDKLKVSVTINPMAEIVQEIGKDKVEVNKIVPDGVEAHDFEPKPRDLEGLNKSQIFVYNGLDMEHWVEDVKSSINGDVLIVEAAKGIDTIKISEEDEEEHSEDDDHNHEGGVDPHMWLSLKEMKKASENVLEALKTKDPENADYYQENYDSFVKNIDDLYNEYSEKFSTVENKNFVTGHAAFAYLCRDFGLKQESIAGVWGEGEVTPKKLEALANFCKQNNIKVIFTEANESARESETLAKEINSKVEKIYSLENKEDDKTYLEGMRYNLETIYNSLK